MLFLELPIEILVHILGYVGTSFFRSDLSRLTVCKHWNNIARTVCFRDFRMTPKTLRRLASCSQSSLTLVQNNLRSLNLKLKSYEKHDYIPEHKDDQRFAEWKTELSGDLLHLANVVGASRDFRTLRLQAISEWHARRPTRRNYLYRSTICTILKARSLTSLELDLSGTELLPLVNGQPDEQSHICITISAFLPTLHRLRLRMHRICGDVLRLQEPCTDLRLNEVLINLSLPYDSPFITLAPHALGCSSPGAHLWARSETLRLEQDLKEHAEALAAQMVEPRMVRILTHAPTDCGMHALDVLTGKYLRLGEDAEWDDAGEVLAESDDESELSDLNPEEGLYGVFQAAVWSGE